MHRKFLLPSNPDVHAFHEGFADCVAMLQHFTFPEIVAHQIAATRGALDSQENLLVQLAAQFGRATGKRMALRDAIGEQSRRRRLATARTGSPGVRRRRRVRTIEDGFSVSAVFDAFLSIYKRRTADLVRLATGGSGVLRTGAIHPDLVQRLADRRSSRPSTCSRCASGPSTTVRPRTSPSASICGRSSRPTSTWWPMTTSITASRSSRLFAGAASFHGRPHAERRQPAVVLAEEDDPQPSEALLSTRATAQPRRRTSLRGITQDLSLATGHGPSCTSGCGGIFADLPKACATRRFWAWTVMARSSFLGHPSELTRPSRRLRIIGILITTNGTHSCLTRDIRVAYKTPVSPRTFI